MDHDDRDYAERGSGWSHFEMTVAGIVIVVFAFALAYVHS